MGKTAVKEQIYFNTLNVAFQSTATIGIGIVLIMAGRQIQNGSFSIGDLALFIVYFGFISDWTAKTGTLIASLGQINVSVDRMIEFIDTKNQEDLVRSGPVYMKNEPEG